MPKIFQLHLLSHIGSWYGRICTTRGKKCIPSINHMAWRRYTWCWMIMTIVTCKEESFLSSTNTNQNIIIFSCRMKSLCLDEYGNNFCWWDIFHCSWVTPLPPINNSGCSLLYVFCVCNLQCMHFVRLNLCVQFTH